MLIIDEVLTSERSERTLCGENSDEERWSPWEERLGLRGGESGEVVLVLRRLERVGDGDGEVKAVFRRWSVRVVWPVRGDGSRGWKRFCRIFDVL